MPAENTPARHFILVKKTKRTKKKPIRAMSAFAEKAKALSNWGQIMSPLGRPVALQVISILENNKDPMTIEEITAVLRGSGAKRRLADVLNTLGSTGVVIKLIHSYVLNRAWIDSQHSKLISHEK